MIAKITLNTGNTRTHQVNEYHHEKECTFFSCPGGELVRDFCRKNTEIYFQDEDEDVTYDYWLGPDFTDEKGNVETTDEDYVTALEIFTDALVLLEKWE